MVAKGLGFANGIALSSDENSVLADLQDPSGASPLTTGATETAQRLYIHNADGRSLGWLAR